MLCRQYRKHAATHNTNGLRNKKIISVADTEPLSYPSMSDGEGQQLKQARTCSHTSEPGIQTNFQVDSDSDLDLDYMPKLDFQWVDDWQKWLMQYILDIVWTQVWHVWGDPSSVSGMAGVTYPCDITSWTSTGCLERVNRSFKWWPHNVTFQKWNLALLTYSKRANCVY